MEMTAPAMPEENPADLIGRLVALPRAEFLREVQTLPEELRGMATEMHEEVREKKLGMCRDLVQRLERDRLNPTIIAKRTNVEPRWAEDERQYQGFDRIAPKADRTGAAPTGQKDLPVPPGLNLTMSRTKIWTARVVNMVCPGSILPGDTMPTPKVELDPDNMGAQLPDSPAEYMGDPGVESFMAMGGMAEQPPGIPAGMAPQPNLDETQRQMAEKASAKMNRLIRDQFAESKVPREIRLAAADLCKLGVGFLAGPEQRQPMRTKFRRVEGKDKETGKPFAVYERTPARATKPKPMWRRVNPRYAFPEMVARMEDATFFFELQLLTKRELQNLKKEPGFEEFQDQFDELLAADYKFELKGEINTSLLQWNSVSPTKEATSARVAVWRFFGYVEPKDLQALDCGWKDGDDIPLMEIWFCDGRILQANTMIPDGAARLPYYSTKLVDLDDTMFGGGIPYQAREAQQSISSLWRAAQYNAAASAGCQLGYADGKAFPTDGDFRVFGPKSWRLVTGQAQSIQDVLSVMTIPNNAKELLMLLDRRVELFDQEINLPPIAQGQPDQATPTSTGLAMHMRAASVAVLDLGQNCEDGWITPLFESAYHYNMVYSDDESIKGDFDCVSRLVSDNVMREIKAQHMLVLNNMKAADPQLAQRLKPDLFYSRLATALELDPELFMTDQEVADAAAKNPPPPDPVMERLKLDAAKFEREAEQAAEDRRLDHIEKMEELRIRAEEVAGRNYVAEKQLEIKLAEIAAGQQTTIDKLRTQIGIATEREKTARTQIGVKAQEAAEKQAADERNDQIEIEHEKNPRFA